MGSSPIVRFSQTVARDWTDANQHDPGITVLELLAYADDLLSYLQDSRPRWRRIVFLMATAGAGALLFRRCRSR